MKYWGVINGDNKQFSIAETSNLIDCIYHWGGNLFIWWVLSWDESKIPMTQDHFQKFKMIREKCRQRGINFWVGMKPGDKRYCKQSSDREGFLQNVLAYIEGGADGFYLAMDDMHPKRDKEPFGHVRPEDAKHHARLISEIQHEIGDKFKAICGQHYQGMSFDSCAFYWLPILEVLDPGVMITWTGPETWNKSLGRRQFSWIKRPVMLFDNFFASDSKDPEKAPIYPYSGRKPDLVSVLDAVVINPNKVYPWQYSALYTAMEFYRDPERYNPELSFRKAVMELGENYQHLVRQMRIFQPNQSERS